MASTDDDTQDDIFYGPMWTKELTIFLVDHLVNQVHTKRWVWNKPSIPAIRLVRDHLNWTFDLYFTEQEVVRYVDYLRNRFHSFERLINNSAVFWKRDNNYIYADPRIWSTLIQEDNIVKAYMHKGEPLYRSFELLFKDPTVEHNIPVYENRSDFEGNKSDEDAGGQEIQTIHEVPSQISP